MSGGTVKILLLAGEESGILYAERLKRALARDCARRAMTPEFRGYETEGFKVGDLAVMGFGPVLRRLPYFLGVAKTMKGVIRDWRPNIVVTIDYPGLNLKLAAYAKSLGIPAIHIVCPQVWAWHQNRIPRVAAALTKLLCFFPFEPALFEGTGLDVTFIGHPMADIFAEERTASGAVSEAGGEKLLALLPGSRLGEIRRNLPRLLKSLALLQPVAGGLRVVIPAANERAELEINRIRGEFQDVTRAIPIEVRRGGARDLLRRATCAAVASGTATLEAALARCPTVLVYAVSPFLAWFARRVITGIHYIGLANVIWEKSGGAGEPPMPELLQEAFTPEAVAARLEPLLSSAAARADAARRLDAAMALLRSDGDALGLAAREILNVV
ncbi:MAG: lipid-A-disaccharide synthase [Kiritimatiellia bacterium]